MFEPLFKTLAGFAAVLLLLFLLSRNIWRRFLSLRLCRAQQRPRLLFRAAIAGFRRHYGQTWEEFSCELSLQNGPLAQHFRALAEHCHHAAAMHAEVNRQQEMYGELQALSREVTRLWYRHFEKDFRHIFRRGQEQIDLAAFLAPLNPLCWWKADEPKA